MLGRFMKTVMGIGRSKMVLVVRTDLKMSQGKIAAQCAHAAISLYDAALRSDHNRAELNHWMSHGQPKIVLRVACESTMRKLHENATNAGLNACLVYDAGQTQVEKGSLTVLGIGPNLSVDIDKVTLSLKLL